MPIGHWLEEERLIIELGANLEKPIPATKLHYVHKILCLKVKLEQSVLLPRLTN